MHKLICNFVIFMDKNRLTHDEDQFQRVQPSVGFSGQFFRIFKIISFCFVVARFDLVHDVEAIHGL